jgi:hypothetical protein
MSLHLHDSTEKSYFLHRCSLTKIRFFLPRGLAHICRLLAHISEDILVGASRGFGAFLVGEASARCHLEDPGLARGN